MKFPSLKKWWIWSLLPALMCIIFVSGWLFFVASGLPQVDFLSDPGVTLKLDVPDWQGRYSPYIVGPENPDWTPLEEIPPDLRNAVLAGEDFSFYSHKGVDWFELRESLIKDLRERRFARGASTITQQLAKNLFLSRDKTVKRKVSELILARRMEMALTKDRILELYLNVVELGDNVYGVGAGALQHFAKQPSDLTLRESAFLAAMLPGPKVYDPDQHPDRVMNRSDHLLGVMLKGRMITDEQSLATLVEFPLAEKPSEPANPEQYSEPTESLPPKSENESITNEEQGSKTREERVESREVPTDQDGILEIPIK